GRAVTAVESSDFSAIAALGKRVMASTKQAPRIGLTGAAGAGKSTLLAALAGAWPGADRVGGIAVDPSSEVSGGAVLGDRYRLYSGESDSGRAEQNLFMRSMAARGSPGALSRHVGLGAAMLEEVGFSPILIETAGAGQGDTGVKDWVDCLLLVLTPESGDVVQMLKAGLMEWADIYVVNKADREGAKRFAAQLRGLVTTRRHPDGVRPADRVQLVQANKSEPADLKRLIDVIQRVAESKARPRQVLWQQVSSALLEHAAMQAFRRKVIGTAEWDAAVLRCSAGEMTADALARQLLSGADESSPSEGLGS
ncbi:MAG: hypothetical protein ACRDRL_00500, partial [Sciscionella sp.]